MNTRVLPTAKDMPHPYSRKSSRQQFSACGACRMRRVRCDLKDLPPNSHCSNCAERALQCVDEFADVKTVKLLRRGRRLQQVEYVRFFYFFYFILFYCLRYRAIYGKLPQAVPHLHNDFFNSKFSIRFSLHRVYLQSNYYKIH